MRIRIIILVALGVFLIWEVITRGVAAYLAEASPEMALRLHSSQATALLNVAAKTFRRDLAPKKAESVTASPQNEASPPDAGAVQSPLTRSQTQARAEVRSLAERALVSDPLNARAFSILGQLSVHASDDKQAESFMHAAVRHSLFESEAVYWMLQKMYKDKNYKKAILYATILLKTHQRALLYVMPELGSVAETQDGAAELKRLLVANPIWRRGFFDSISNHVSDARTPLAILLSLKDTVAPPTTTELRGYLNFLIERKFYDLAYYTWLQFLPPEQLNKVGNLFNGDFELVPSGLPFDWVWIEKSGVNVEISTGSDQESGHGLHLRFGPGRVDFSGIGQFILLPPGNYHFQGSYQADLVSQRGLQWRIKCAAAPTTFLGESSPIRARESTWQDFEFSFSVPDSDCPAQHVVLVSGARTASEQMISGTVWYDNLRIVRETVVAPLDKRS